MRRVPIGIDETWLKELIEFEADMMKYYKSAKFGSKSSFVRNTKARIKLFNEALNTMPDANGLHWVRLPFQYLVDRVKNIATKLRMNDDYRKRYVKALSDEDMKLWNESKLLLERARYICHAINESGVYMYWRMLSFNDPKDPWWM